MSSKRFKIRFRKGTEIMNKVLPTLSMARLYANNGWHIVWYELL